MKNGKTIREWFEQNKQTNDNVGLDEALFTCWGATTHTKFVDTFGKFYISTDNNNTLYITNGYLGFADVDDDTTIEDVNKAIIGASIRSVAAVLNNIADSDVKTGEQPGTSYYKPEMEYHILEVFGEEYELGVGYYNNNDVIKLHNYPHYTCCAICGDRIDNLHSHNAAPVVNGRCCGCCNDLYVIPTRIAEMINKNKK